MKIRIKSTPSAHAKPKPSLSSVWWLLNSWIRQFLCRPECLWGNNKASPCVNPDLQKSKSRSKFPIFACFLSIPKGKPGVCHCEWWCLNHGVHGGIWRVFFPMADNQKLGCCEDCLAVRHQAETISYSTEWEICSTDGWGQTSVKHISIYIQYITIIYIYIYLDLDIHLLSCLFIVFILITV